MCWPAVCQFIYAIYLPFHRCLLKLGSVSRLGSQTSESAAPADLQVTLQFCKSEVPLHLTGLKSGQRNISRASALQAMRILRYHNGSLLFNPAFFSMLGTSFSFSMRTFSCSRKVFRFCLGTVLVPWSVSLVTCGMKEAAWEMDSPLLLCDFTPIWMLLLIPGFSHQINYLYAPELHSRCYLPLKVLSLFTLSINPCNLPSLSGICYELYSVFLDHLIVFLELLKNYSGWIYVCIHKYVFIYIKSHRITEEGLPVGSINT